MMLCLILICFIFALVTLFDRFSRDARLIRQIPGPKAWPVIGNSMFYTAPPAKLFLTMRSIHKQYGSLTQIHAMNLRFVHACEPADLEQLMSSSEFLPKSDTYRFLAPWLGNSLLLSSGKEWYHRRKLLTKAFHFNILKKFMDTFNTETEHFIKQVEKETLEEHTDLFAIVGPVALRVISETAMGISLGDEEVAFDKYFQSILAMGECFISRVSKLWLHNDFLFNLSKIARVQQCLLKHLHGFTEKVIEDRRQLMREPRFKQVESSPPSNDRHSKMVLIDLLLENEKSGLLDSEGIREEVDTFMFAGYDTTAITMSFFLMAIANEPDIQDKIYEELRQVIGDSQRLPTMQELNELRYLECCIKESLRLYPSVPFIGRKLTKETVLSGYTVPANTTCFIMIYDLHRRADIYPDPERFDPDRFLPENISKRHIYSYLPFSAGLRNCIGQKFAMLEMKMVLSGLLQRFRLEPVTRPSDIVFRADIVLRTSNPIYVRFRSRN